MAHNNRSKNIAFRVDKEVFDFMHDRACEMNVTPGLWARGLVIAERHRPHSETVEELQAVKKQLQNLATTIEKIRINQSRSLYLVLTHIGKMDPEKANAIATSKLLD
jgi:hypothetical protein